MDTDEADFQQVLDGLTDAKNHLVQHNGYLPRQWVFGSAPRFPVMRGGYVPGDTVYYWRANQGVHQPQGHRMGPARFIGVEGSNLLVPHRATATKCAKEQDRMASPAAKEMREMLMMRLGAEDPDSRKTC